MIFNTSGTDDIIIVVGSSSLAVNSFSTPSLMIESYCFISERSPDFCAEVFSEPSL